MVPVQIYSDAITPRLQYACRVLFDCVLKVPYHIYNHNSTLRQEGPAIWYSSRPPGHREGIHIVPAGLLESEEIVEQSPVISWKNEIPFLFWGQNTGPQAFDPFSAAFYMATRYEEYLPFTPDKFGRFAESASLSGKNGFTQIPVVHYWARQIADALEAICPDFSVTPTRPEVLFSYDIDVAYAYRGRSAMLHALSLGNDLLSGRFSNIYRKIKTGFGYFFDPSDTYKLLEDNLLPTFVFFLLAKRRGPYDRNISPQKTVLKQLVKRFAAGKSIIGIHPSYLSSEKNELIPEEKELLENISGQSITSSRQHFLRFRFPDTFQALEQAGIRHDYSLQYPEMPGFRAGLCVPFPFFNLRKNRETGLMLHPGCIMETTFRDDLHLPAAESLNWYLNLWQQVEKVGGQFITIWHNDTLWDNLPDNHPLAFRQVHNQLVDKFCAHYGMKTKSLPGIHGRG